MTMYDYLIFDRKPTTADQTEDSLAEVSSGFSSEWLNAFREEQDALFLATAFVLLRNYAQEDTLQIAFLPGKRKNEDTCHPPLFCETTVKENDDFFSLLSACRTFLRFSTTPTSDGEKRPVIHAISPVDHAWITFFAPGAEKASFGFTYPSSLFSPSTMQNMLSQWKQILHAVSEVAGNTEKACLSLSRIVLEPLSLQVAEKNAQTLTGTIWERFAEQVKKTPDAVGLVDGKRHYTYREMREKAVALSTHLAEQGVVRGDHVAFYAQRCAESIFAILAILRCGAAYVPLNPEAPIFHDREILRDCEARVLLTYGGKASGICPSLDLEDEALFRPLMGREKEQDAYSLPISDEDLAYIIYTSGTTGKPKGVMVTQKNVLHLVSDSRLRPAQGKRRILAQTVQLAFDPSTFDLWTTLLYGGCLHIVTEDVLLNGKQLERYLKQHAITAMCLTTALFNYYALEQTTLFSSLRYLLFGGEKVSDEAVQKVHAAYPSLMMVNGYGPTENTTCTTIQVVGDGDWERTPIGRPVEGSGVVILRNGTVCGVGIPGELCAWGNGVSRGYLKREELNAEKFTSNPFGEGKLYHTGDLCRCLPDGQIDFLGRMDRQIKLRGFRIELEDIESNVKKLAGIQDAAVVVDHSENPHLIAFLVMEEEGDISLLQSELAKRLPSYMLPSHWVRVDNIPLTNNGKVHREALLASFSPQTGEEGYEAPQTETELALCHLFEELLGEKPIGRRAHFIEWGGNSLHVVKLLHRVEETFGVSLGMADVFAHPYPLTLAKYIEEKRAYTKESQANAFPPVMPARYYPLSPTQQGIVMEAQWGAQSIAYNNPTWFYYAHRLEAKRLEQALKTMVKRHEILRTRFVVVDAQLMQEIVDTAPIDFAVLNADELAKTDRKQEGEAEWFSWQSVLVRPFALDTCPLFRVRLIHKGKGSYLFLDLHHAITDGISLGLFLAELSALYGGKALCAPAAQYKSYSEWMSHRDTRSQRQAWQEDLLPLPQPLDLVTDALRPKIRTDRGDITYLSVPETLTHSVHALCQKRGVTAYMVFFSALAVYLAKVGRSEDFLLGSSFSGRVHRQSEDMLGMFVQTLPLRVKPQADKTFFGFLEEMREYLLAVHDRQEIAMQELVRDLRLPTDPAHHPLYDIVFVYQNQQTLAPIFDGEKGKVLASAHTTAKFDLTFYLEDVAQGYRLGVEYNRDLFTPQTAQRMLVQYRAILQQTLAQPEMTIGQIEAVLAPEKEKILGEWNATQADYPKDKTLVDLFIEQVRKTPKRAALRFRGESYTYETLYAQARRVCRQLQQHGVKPGDFVALYVQRCPEMVAGMLGTLLAGASYVPINTMYPKERVQFILEDSEAKALLLGRLPLPVETEVPQITLYPEEEDGQEAREERGVPDGCAYVIYTSGTSGKPKGVMVSHRNVVRLLHNTRMPFSFSEQDVWTMFHSYGFDFSVWEMYGALLYGGCLVIVEEETAKNAQAFYALLKEEKVTVLNQVPSSFYALSPFVRGEDGLCVRYLIFGGEALTPSKVKHWHEAVPGCQIINMYGITETTVHVTYQEITEKEMAETGSPIGRPIPTLQTYIMQKDVLCGVGIPGELCVAGDGVSLGYLHRDELTKKRFVSNPFGEGKMYRSGDLARYLPDGRMEYLGRIDQQVKVRGFRIELGEIEEALREQDGIGDVAVLADTFSGERSLCAYLVSEETLDITAVKEKLRQRLPEYMVPPAMMQIARLPLTANGKLDRRGLPKIEKPKAKAYVAPETESEKLVCRLFEEILAVRGVGCMDNFFELGGHSLRAAELLYRLEEESGKKIAFHELFHASNVRELADVLDKADGKTEVNEIPVNAGKNSAHRMSNVELRTYLVAQRDAHGLSYNVPEVLSINGHLDAKKLLAALQAMAKRHRILRTDYIFDGESGKRHIHDQVNVDFEMHIRKEAKRMAVAQELSAWIKPFTLDQAPLWRVRLFSCQDGDLLFIDMHHIICDGFSYRIFLRELDTLYRGEKLPEVKVQYDDYVKNGWDEEAAQDFSYWSSVYADGAPVLDLITDGPRPKVQSFSGETCSRILSPSLSEAAGTFARKHGLSLYMVYLAGVSIVLSRYCRQEDIVVGSPFSGRTRPEIMNMLGMFVNVLPIRLALPANTSLGDFLIDVREKTALASEHQSLSLDHLAETVLPEMDGSRNPLFDVVLAVQTQEESKPTIADYPASFLPSIEQVAKFDLSFNVDVMEDKHRISLQYATALFHAKTAEIMLAHYEKILAEMVSAQDTTQLAQLAILLPEEEKKICSVWNATKAPYPHAETMITQWEKQAKETPQAIALVEGARSWTYQQLRQSARALASALQKKGVKQGDYVAVMAGRHAETVLAKLAILYCGAAYVAINPAYPDERIQTILIDCHAKLLLVQGERLSVPCPQIDLLQEATWVRQNRMLGEVDESDLSGASHSDATAALVYTSGTTGVPKGVKVTHKGILNLIFNRERLAIPVERRTVQTGQMSFDASFYEIWGTLLFGGTLHLVPESMVLDPETLGNYMREKQINCLFLTTALFNQYAMENPEVFSPLKQLIFGGECVSDEAFHKIHRMYPHLAICNGYGPSENTTVTTVYFAQDGHWERTPIGKPLNNVRAYVVEPTGVLAGIGIPGELWISGDSLSSGYLGREKWNESQFVHAPFDSGKLYRTGDLARFLPDGNIDFLGRIDEQVKIRGFRIEPAEVENALRRCDDVRDCVVVARPDAHGDLALFGYVVWNEKLSAEQEEQKKRLSHLHQELVEKLPAYMIPTGLMALDALPLTTNSKVNVRALPEIKTSTMKDYVAPSTELEMVLCSLYEEIVGAKQVSVQDSFFILGGHSLSAVRLANRIRERLGRCVSVGDIFAYPTVSSLAAHLEENREQSDVKRLPIPVVPQKPFYSMSDAQRRIYMVSKLNKDGVAYNIPSLFKIHGEVDSERLRNSLQSLVDRYEILRTCFTIQNGEMIQNVRSQGRTDFAVQNIPEEQDPAQLLAQQTRPFSLEEGPLLRMRLLVSDSASYLFWDIHHIIADGVSVPVLQDEFARLYRGETLPAPVLQYRDASAWMAKQDISADKKYWLETFSELPPVLDIATDFVRPAEQNFQGETISIPVTEEIMKRMKQYAIENETTDFILFCAAVTTLLQRYSLQEDIVLGMPVSGRYHQQMETMPGMFVKTLPLRMHLEQDAPVSAVFEQTKNIVLQAMEHQRYPYEELMESLDISKDPSRNPLFDVLITQNEENTATLSLGDAKLFPQKIYAKEAKFDLTFSLEKYQNRWQIGINYATALFTQDHTERMLKQLHVVLDQMLKHPDQAIRQVVACTQEEKRLILEQYSVNEVASSSRLNLISCWEKQVRDHSEDPALVDDHGQLSYKEVDEKTQHLAAHLQSLGVGKGDFVAIIADRSMEMVMAVLAILRSGAAYIPIDPEYPPKRIEHILSQGNPKVILMGTTISAVDAVLSEYAGEAVLCSLSDPLLWENTDHFQVVYPEEDDPIYCIFTSGTTGIPKGVLNVHRGVANTITWLQEHMSLTRRDTILLKTNYVFDVSVSELLWWFVSGCRLAILAPGEEKNARAILHAVKRFTVNVVNFVPSMYSFFLQVMQADSSALREAKSLRYLLLAGEALPEMLVRESYTLAEKAGLDWKLINLYGPTEASIFATYYDCPEKPFAMCIGRPLGGTSAYILQGDKLCGIGVPGELVLGGAGLAKGYLHRADQTKQRFVPNPFGKGCLYRTGDRAYWRADGQIVFLGRMDSQVKVRGFRIELGEIDAVLRQDPSVRDCAVLVRPDSSGDPALCAYIVPVGAFDVEHYRKIVRDNVPAYMVPSYFIPIEKVPTNTNGKLDQKALPEIRAEQEVYVAPQTDLEKMVCHAYEEVLQVKRVGMGDHFFELGGHSLKVMVLMHVIEQNCGVLLDFRDIYFHPGVRELCRLVQAYRDHGEKTVTRAEHIPQAQKKAFYPCMMMQRDVYLAQMQNPEALMYNMPILYRLRQDIEPDRLETALQALLGRHSLLRTWFTMQEGDIVQSISSDATLSLEKIQLDAETPVESAMASLVRPFALDCAPLVHATLLETPTDRYLLLDMHHLISDGASLAIYERDLEALYANKTLEPITLDYKDISEWAKTRQPKNHRTLTKADVLSGHFPEDHYDSSMATDTVSFTLSPATTAAISHLAAEEGTTRHNIYLLAFSVALSRFSGGRVPCIGAPFSLRQTEELRNVPGLLVNVLPISIEWSQTDRVRDLLRRIDENMMQLRDEVDYSETLEKPDSAPQVVLNYSVRERKTKEAETPMCSVVCHYEEAAKFEMVFGIREDEHETDLTLTYMASRFEGATMASLLETFLQVLMEVIEDTKMRVDEIHCLSSDQEKLLSFFSTMN